MAARRLAFALICLLCLVPVGLRQVRGRPSPPRACQPDGRGSPPRHWIGCAADPGARRDLDGRERLLLGLPLDPNSAGPDELGLVPGLSPRLGKAVVAEREAGGPFASVKELEDRVRGVGPARLAKARGHLEIGPARPGPERAGDGGRATR